MSVPRVPSQSLDSIDRQLLDELTSNARQSAATLATRLNLSPSAVRRRIARLEESGAILQYTIVAEPGPSVEAYVELSLASGEDVTAFLHEVTRRPGIQEGSAIAGRPDLILRLRAHAVDELADAVNRLRALSAVADTRTLLALATIRRAPLQLQPSPIRPTPS